MDYSKASGNNCRDTYYQNEHQYYQYDATSPTSSVPNNYRHYSDGRFDIADNKTARRRRNSRVRSSMMDQHYQASSNNSHHYYNQEPQQQHQQDYYNTYQSKDPRMHQYKHRNHRNCCSSKSYYHESEHRTQQDFNQNQLQFSPGQQYQEEIIYSPRKKSSPKRKHVKQQKQVIQIMKLDIMYCDDEIKTKNILISTMISLLPLMMMTKEEALFILQRKERMT